MDCETVQRDNIPERYLAGTLDPQLKEQWELHYFGCDQCAELLATWQAIDKPLRRMAGSIRQEIAPKRQTSKWLWAGAAIAAALVFALASRLTMSTGQNVSKSVAVTKAPASADYTELAMLEAPAYQRSAFRATGSKEESQFQAAMEAYQRHDYSLAINGLRTAVALDPNAAAPRFFLGACYLLTADAAAGARELEPVASGDSPFAQEAQFDLAKAYLRLGAKDRALATLRKLTDTPGDFRESAQTMVTKLTKMP